MHRENSAKNHAKDVTFATRHYHNENVISDGLVINITRSYMIDQFKYKFKDTVVAKGES